MTVEKSMGANALAVVANRITSMGDEGRLFGSDGKDYANTMQTVVQQWVKLEAHDEHMQNGSVSRTYGEIRKIKQTYLEGGDHWQVSGKSWHWSPPVANEVYEISEARP